MIIIIMQGSKIALIRLYLRVPQAERQVEILLFLVKINFFPIYVNNFCDAGQVPIFRYFEACHGIKISEVLFDEELFRNKPSFLIIKGQ